MRLRTAVVVAAVVLLPGGARAQGTTGPVQLTRAIVDRMIPLLRAEAANASTLDPKLRAAGMSRTTYGSYKNSIKIAVLDQGDRTRLTRKPVFVKVREVNMELIRAIEDSMPKYGEDFQHVGEDSPSTASPCSVLCSHF